MSRPIEHGKKAIHRDVEDLLRILKRAMSDPKRTDAERRALEAHLNATITMLLNGKRSKVVRAA